MNAVSLTKLGRMVVLAALFAVGTAAVGAGDVAAQGGKPKIAISITADKTLNQKEVNVLTRKFLAPFTGSGMYNVIDQSEVFSAEVQKQAARHTSGDVRDSEIIKLGRQRGAKYICMVELDDAFGGFNIGARMTDTESGETYLTAGEMDVKGDLNTIDFSQVAQQLFDQIHGRSNMRGR